MLFYLLLNPFGVGRVISGKHLEVKQAFRINADKFGPSGFSVGFFIGQAKLGA
jgi:hypothetical protein